MVHQPVRSSSRRLSPTVKADAQQAVVAAVRSDRPVDEVEVDAAFFRIVEGVIGGATGLFKVGISIEQAKPEALQPLAGG